jgi:hypothetical protein
MFDTYTKWMLTIIAITLIVIAVHDVIHTAVAQNFARVQICDPQNCMQLFPIATNVQGRTVTVWGMPIVQSR